MRSKRYIFECALHPKYGSLGWRPKGMDNADPLSGMAVAHDVLEHFPGGDMGVEDELQALGASFYVRKYTTNMHSLGANVAADLPDVLAHVHSEGMSFFSPGRTAPIDVEYEVDDAIHHFREEAAYSRQRTSSQELAWVRGWMRRGYRRAVKRWGDIDTRSLFDEIQREADRHLKRAEEGLTELEVKLTFYRGTLHDTRRASVEVKAKQHYEEWLER